MSHRWVHTVRVDLLGRPESLLKIELEDIAAAGAAETLANPVLGAGWLRVLQDALAPHDDDWLVWRQGGLGRGKELRRGFSAILGRFMARAYLERRHGIRDFAPISGPSGLFGGAHLSRDNPKIDLPDWVALDAAGGLVLAEAKGSHEGGNGAPASWGIGTSASNPLARAVRQVKNTVLKDDFGRLVPIRRWAVASRWACEDGHAKPYLVAWDPEDGPEYDPQRLDQMRIELRRHATAAILAGMGLEGLADDVVRGETSGHLTTGAVRLHGTSEADDDLLFGVALGPLGVINLADVDLSLLRVIEARTGVKTYAFGLTLSEVKAALHGLSRPPPETEAPTDDERFGRFTYSARLQRRFQGDARAPDAPQPRHALYQRDRGRRIVKLDTIEAIEPVGTALDSDLF